MTTNLEIITDAYRDANIIPASSSPSAEQGKTGLRKLNQLMAQWEQDDVAVDWYTQVALSDTAPCPEWAEWAIVKNLAITLLGSNGGAPTPLLALEADQALRSLKARSINNKLQPADNSHLPIGSGSYGGGQWNIETDS